MSPAFCNIMYVIICMSHPGGGTLFGCPLIHLSTNKAKKLQALQVQYACSISRDQFHVMVLSITRDCCQLLQIIAELRLLSLLECGGC